MMSWKGRGTNQSWPTFIVLPRHIPAGAEENQEEPQSGYSVSEYGVGMLTVSVNGVCIRACMRGVHSFCTKLSGGRLEKTTK
jgi:hypothetical protein